MKGIVFCVSWVCWQVFHVCRVGHFHVSESQMHMNTVVIPYSVTVFRNRIFYTFHTLYGGAGSLQMQFATPHAMRKHNEAAGCLDCVTP
eukprot:1157938-Pelagomonas_calceolata.AAC.3